MTSRWHTALLTLLASVLFLGTSAAAQDLELLAHFGTTNRSAIFQDFNSPGKTDGTYTDGRPGQSGWTWERAGANIEVYDNTHTLICTFVNGATSDSEGTITDAPGNGNNGGTWNTP